MAKQINETTTVSLKLWQLISVAFTFLVINVSVMVWLHNDVKVELKEDISEVKEDVGGLNEKVGGMNTTLGIVESNQQLIILGNINIPTDNSSNEGGTN